MWPQPLSVKVFPLMGEFFNTDSKNTIILFNGKSRAPPRCNYSNLCYNNVDHDLEDEKLLRGCAASKSLFINLFSINWLILFVFFVGPPRVAFSWRHWAHWTGPYKGKDPTGELVEMYGMAVAEVDENLKIKSIDVHYDPNQILMKLEGQK